MAIVPVVDGLKDLVITAAELAAATGLVIVPAVPEHDYEPEVLLGRSVLDLPGSVGLAATLGDSLLSGDPSAHLARHKGKTGHVSIAFAANVLVHFWEQRTGWYQARSPAEEHRHRLVLRER